MFYKAELSAMGLKESSTLRIDYDHLMEHSPQLAFSLLSDTERYRSFLILLNLPNAIITLVVKFFSFYLSGLKGSSPVHSKGIFPMTATFTLKNSMSTAITSRCLIGKPLFSSLKMCLLSS